MVDAGADMFVGHGPHVLRGIEIYKGKPILYSLGDFIFENETLQRLPSENYETYDLGATAHVNDFNDARYNFDKSGFPADRLIWEAVVAVPKFRGDATRPSSRSTPSRSGSASRAASAAGRNSPRASSGQKILGDLTKLSAAMGTKIAVPNGIGYVDASVAAEPA